MPHPALLFAARCLLAVHFGAELLDKILRFGAWTETVAAAGLPLPAAEMGLVVALLTVGTTTLVTGWRVRMGIVALLVFSLPPLFFESSHGALQAGVHCRWPPDAVGHGAGRLVAGCTGPPPESAFARPRKHWPGTAGKRLGPPEEQRRGEEASVVVAQPVRGTPYADLRTSKKPLSTSRVSHVVLQERCCYLDDSLQRLSFDAPRGSVFHRPSSTS